jgi:hypothetical protein
MLNKDYVQIELDKFKKYVIQQSRSNLTKGGKNVEKRLYNSIGGESISSKNSMRLAFEMEDYGTFQDLGVKGKRSSAKAPNSPYKFGSGTGKKGGLTEGINKWVRARRFQFRDKKGRFTSFESTAFLITRSIYNKGIKPSFFFTKPFEKAFERLPDDIIEAYGLDVESLINIK